MSEFNLLPIYKNGIGELVDGIMIKLPEFCKCKKNDKCDKFYEGIFESEEGLHICPYGFNTYVSKNKENIDIFTGFRVREKYNAKKADSKITKSDNNKVISYKEMEQYIKKYVEYIQLNNEHKYLKEFINNTVHDIRKFNAHIKLKGTRIINKTQSQTSKFSNEIEGYAKNVWAMSSYISTRLDAYNYLYSMTPFKSGDPYEFNFYKTFDKIRMCLMDEAKKNNLTIKVRCKGTCSSIQAYDSIELLPFLVIDNAIKYTVGGEKIIIEINDEKDRQTIHIKSIGPKIDKDEIQKVFTRGYRSRNAEQFRNDGSGIGLYLVKEICNANNLLIEIESEPTGVKKNKDIEYGYFNMTICALKNA